MLISCAHALVHIFELALPSVEQLIGDEHEVGPKTTGMLGTTFRLPFGLGAMLAGWLADRYGSKRLLLVYLAGCVGVSLIMFWTTSLNVLFALMLAMGCFASIYHPAGLALISRNTTAANRPAALGWHGIIGSFGIAGAPMLAAIAFSSDAITWRGYYIVLCVPAVIIAVLIAFTLNENRESSASTSTNDTESDEDGRWKAYAMLVVSGAMMGFVYASFMHFLPRYLDSADIRPDDWSDRSFRNLLAGIVLFFGTVGQGLAGRIARPGKLEGMLVFVVFGNIPFLIAMAYAEGPWRLAACCGLALVHFMNQPVYNSLIAQFVPAARRSTGYGFSNMMCFGIGALGPTCVGYLNSDRWAYLVLALVSFAATLVAAALLRHVSQAHAKQLTEN